jgi:hypothetical protein
MKGYKVYKLSQLNREWVNNFPKTINENNCWIPPNRPDDEGYVPIQVEKVYFRLHRLIVAIYHNLDYSDAKWDSRHNTGCSRACFNPDHLQPGTHTDNMRDRKRDGTSNYKEVCPECGGPYTTRITKTGWSKGKIVRICNTCRIRKRQEKARKLGRWT